MDRFLVERIGRGDALVAMPGDAEGVLRLFAAASAGKR
jgi:hypothetical protein